ncbi:hypothetical protein QTP86_016756 [Hemibagrus guttatus]|nr:hypothetical protein QTP86_016756 [Hemibagrus guttatus]
MSVESPGNPTSCILPQECHDFQEVFSKEKATPPPHCPWDCAINLLPNAMLPKTYIYSLSLPENKAMEEYIEGALAAGYIQPSTSTAAAGFFFVEKKDVDLRSCIDYWGLNSVTIRYPYPLPLVPASLEQLRGAQIFTKLDLRSKYNLLRIRKGDEWKTAFHTTRGHYGYLVMPYSLTNAPAVFQSFINELFNDVMDKYMIAYIDDILIYSTSYEDHIHHVRRETITFLGFVISLKGVEMDKSKLL